MEHRRLCFFWYSSISVFFCALSFKSVRLKRAGRKGHSNPPKFVTKIKIGIHALWLHPAAPFGIHFGFLSVVMVTSGTGGATTKCLHWMTAAEARAAWNGVFSKGDRVVPERPARTRGAQKSTSTSWKCHAPGKWGGCPWSQCYFYARLL